MDSSSSELEEDESDKLGRGSGTGPECSADSVSEVDAYVPEINLKRADCRGEFQGIVEGVCIRAAGSQGNRGANSWRLQTWRYIIDLRVGEIGPQASGEERTLIPD